MANVAYYQGGTPGGIVLPASSTDNAVVRWDSTTGRAVQNSSFIIADGASTITSAQMIDPYVPVDGTMNVTGSIALSATGEWIGGGTRSLHANSTTPPVAASYGIRYRTIDATAAPITVNVGSAAALGAGNEIFIKRINSGANAVTIEVDGAGTIDGEANLVLSNQYDWVTLVSDGANYHVSAGNIFSTLAVRNSAGTDQFTGSNVGNVVALGNAASSAVNGEATAGLQLSSDNTGVPDATIYLDPAGTG